MLRSNRLKRPFTSITRCQWSPAEVRRWKISHWHASPALFAKVVGCSYQIRRRTNTSPSSTHVSTPGRLISAGKEYGLWDSRPQDAPQSRRSIRIALLHWRSWKRKHRLQKAGRRSVEGPHSRADEHKASRET